MQLQALTAISPIDGRYRNKVAHLAAYFSEYALMKYRVHVEVAYYLMLADKKFFKLTTIQKRKINDIATQFNEADALLIKKHESITNHDVKAVEYYIKDKLRTLGGSLTTFTEWVHFGLTSQDVNNTAIPLSFKHAMEQVYLPSITQLQLQLHTLAKQWSTVPMLARTHGQPASPTILGKEVMVYVERLQQQIVLLSHIPYTGKFGGATGNFNAHHVAYPKYNWVHFANAFLEQKLGLERQQYTTQIEHYDTLAAHFDGIKRINNILIDLCRDVWTYISQEYFTQKTKAGEIGSSAMPHKVNPIDFENAEGNLGIANALLEHLAAKLPISRLQRDLTDSTVLRNIGVPIAHTIISIHSIANGLGKLILNTAALNRDLDNNWAVVAEAIQTVLRRANYPEPYEALKQLTRGKAINKITVHQFIKSLSISATLKKELLAITPSNYTGMQLM